MEEVEKRVRREYLQEAEAVAALLGQIGGRPDSPSSDETRVLAARSALDTLKESFEGLAELTETAKEVARARAAADLVSRLHVSEEARTALLNEVDEGEKIMEPLLVALERRYRYIAPRALLERVLVLERLASGDTSVDVPDLRRE